jgi:hypothetical protein
MTLDTFKTLPRFERKRYLAGLHDDRRKILEKEGKDSVVYAILLDILQEFEAAHEEAPFFP